MEILAKLFSPARTKLLRVFLFNPDLVLDTKDLVKRTKLTAATIRRELAVLRSIKFIRAKSEERKIGKKRKKISGSQLNPNFTFRLELRDLLNKELFPHHDDVGKRFAHCGRLKLVVLSGIFLPESEQAVDLVLVGDHMKRPLIQKIIQAMEVEVGKELTYAVFDTSEFLYRLHSSDKFVRDIFDFPHECIIDKIGL